MPLDVGLVFVAVVPDRRPGHVQGPPGAAPAGRPRTDATFNLGRFALLLAGLADRSLLIREATEDRLHQDYRSPLFPEAPQLLARLVAAGALASCWSGAGPTMLGICDAADGERRAVGGGQTAHGRRRRPRPSRGPGRDTSPDARSGRSLGAVDPEGTPRTLATMARTFHIRTFGCQMNEHDSERLAGLLVADGLEPTDDVETADVVVLNTCCIRENADNKLYGHLGQLKALRDRRPGMQIAVGGCLAQKDRELVRRARRRTSTWSSAPTTSPRAPVAAAPGAGRGPGRRGPRRRPSPAATATDASALDARAVSPYAAWVTIQTGCDNSCAFCIVPTVRGPEVSRPIDDLVAEVSDAGGRAA